MRVMFVQALSMDEVSSENVYPIGVVTLATHVKMKGHQVEIIDMNIENDPFGRLKENLISYNPEVVCISLRNIDPLANKTSSLIPKFVVAIRMISKIIPTAKIIVGGTGFSLFPERIMNELPEIDYGIIGEAEVSLPTLLSNLENPKYIKGLCYREGEDIKINNPSREFDLTNDYIEPDRLLLDPHKYLGINNYVESIGIETKRGCPFNCAYCVYPNLQGKKLRCREPKKVVDEIEKLNKEFGVKRIHFTDSVVNIPSGHLEAICEEIIRRDIKVNWSGFFREDFLNEDNVFLYEKSGCECFSFSPDGLCQESLDILGKNLKEEDILRAASLVSKTNVVSVYHFMVNVPGESKETLEKGIQLIDKIYDIHSKERNLGTVVLNNIRILPGTPVATIAEEKGIIGPETDLLYPTYYNPEPFNTARYEIETHHLCKNIFMWQEVN